MLIEKYDESFVKLSFLEENEKVSIDNRFAPFVKDYFFNAAFKRGSWDGKKHFFDERYNTLPLGLVNKLEEHMKRWFPKTKIEKDYEEPKSFNFDFTEFYKNLNKADFIEIRDYQQKGFEESLNSGKCILQAATGAGKSLIIWLISKYLTEELKEDLLIIVPQTMLVEQLFGDFDDYGEFRNGVDVGKSTTKPIGKKIAKSLGLNYDELKEEGSLNLDLNKKIVISTWQTLKNKPKSYFARFGAILVDEVHTIDGRVLQEIVLSCRNANWKIGMTGTLKANEVAQMVYEAFFHKQIKLVTPRELINNGHATPVKIHPIIFHYPGKSNYEDIHNETDYIAFNNERLEKITNLVKSVYYNSEHNNTLILFKNVQKGFWRELKENLSFVENLFVVHGDIDLEVREEARKVADSKNNTIILASYSTFSTGVNVKNLHNIFFLESYKSFVNIAQSIGRGMRQHATKEVVRIFDVTDKFDKKNFTYRHFEERLKIYDELKFDVLPPEKYINIIIKNI